MSRFLTFTSLPRLTKTALLIVASKSSGATLGHVGWFGRWRQYAFFPESGAAFNPECMKDICGVIDDLMLARKSQPPR